MDVPALVGRYEVELALGQGALGRTLLARDPVLARHVVVKVVRADLPIDAAGRAALVDRLQQATRAAAAFFHPVMVTVLDMGEDAAAGLFVVFEFVQGSTLREAVAAGSMTRNDVSRLARALGTTLALAHGNGVVHGNVKPDNVMLAGHGPRLLDPGFGTPPGGGLADPAPGFTAPEVIGGAPPSALGDQFSLAATLYTAITGRPPFSGADAEAIAQAVVASKHPAPTAALPELRACPHIDTIFDRALAKDPRRRFPACDAFASALAGSLESMHTPLVTPISQSSIVPRATRRWQNAAAGAAVLVIFALLLLGRGPRSQGVSLKSVAAAFSAAIAPPRAPVRRTRANGAPSTTVAAPAAPTPAPDVERAGPPAAASAEEP
jgi:serine/threonine-protein kinase